jgi:hypothetical protein
MATKKTTGKQLADLMYGGDQMRATPQSRITGPVANAVRKAQQFASQYELDPRIPLLGGTGIDELLSLPEAASLLEDVSYNGMGALVRGGNAATGGLGTFRPDPRITSAIDVAATATGVGQLGGMAARAAPGAVRAGVRNLSTPSTLNPQAGVIKMKGGNWLGGRMMGNMDENVKRLKPIQDPDKRLAAAEVGMERMKNAGGYSESSLQAQQDVIDTYKQQQAVNNWVTSNLGKYVKNQMATPEDPIRLLLDKRTKEIDAKHAKDIERAERMAQRAIDEPDPRRQANLIRESERLKMEANVERQFAMDSIIPSRMQDYSPDADQYLRQRRQEAGFPAEGMGESEAAKRYETLTDDAISTMRAGDVQAAAGAMEESKAALQLLRSKEDEIQRKFNEHVLSKGLSEGDLAALNSMPMKDKAAIIQDPEYQELFSNYSSKSLQTMSPEYVAAQQNPFISKLDPETQLYSGNTADMGFDHVIDILKQDVMEGRIRPEQLSKVSVEDAVRRTMDFDQEAARKMAETQIKATEGFPTYKEYPEGYRWIELAKPSDLTDLPEGYRAEPYKSQYSEGVKIIGPDGKQAAAGDDLDEALRNMSETRLEEALKYEGDTMGHCVGGYCPDVIEGKSRIYSLRDARGEPHVTVEAKPKHYNIESARKVAEQEGLSGVEFGDRVQQLMSGVGAEQSIKQIKGKQNARPIEKYDKYTQDFVKSGQWSDVGDLQNTGLVNVSGRYFTEPELTEASKKYGRMGVMDTDWETARQRHIDAGVPEDEALRNWVEAFKDGRGRLDIPPEAPPEGMAHGGRVHFSDNPDVMALELAGGGLVKKAVKAAAQKAPQQEAFLLAQQRAALPVSKGGLGLPTKNTPEQRAKAMGFDRDTFHGSLRDIKKLDPSLGSTESHAGKGVYSTDSPEDASLNYANIYGPDVSGRVERGMEERDKDFRKIHGRMRDEVLTPRQQEIILQNTVGADNLGVVYPLRVRADKSIHLDAPEANPVRIGPFESYDEVADAYVDTPQTAKFREALDEFGGLGGEANPIYEVVQDSDGPVPARDVFNAVKKTGNESGLYDPYTGDIVSGGVAAGDFVKHFGIDEIRHTPEFRNQQLNIGNEHTISLNPDNVRSRFAAFDPFRKDVATAAALGVLAPDLLAKEKEKDKKKETKKATGGAIQMAAGGAVRMSLGGALAKAGAKGAAKGAKEAAVPLSLPRVRPSTQEILEAAERVGKQQAGEFVKTPLIGKTHNLAGRSKKEVDRLKEVEYKVTPIKDLPVMKPYEAQIGEVNIALPGDQTISDMLLESVDGVPVGKTSEGGALFGRGRLADPEETRAFWASNIGPAELFQKKVTELAQLYNTDMVTAYHLAMGQMSNNFAQHMADANLRAIDYSKLNKDKMNAFDRVVSMGYVDPKTKERVTFENWPGIASPEDALLAMKEDPKLRKWFNNRMKTEDVTKKSDLPYGKSIEWAMTEPELRNMEINLTGLSAGRMKPGAELIPDSAHQTYSHDIPGTALGRAPELSPFSISFPDATAFVREKYRAPDFTGTIQKVFPHQVVDEAYLDDMYKYYTQLRKVRGFKEGGDVKAPAAQIDGEQFVLAAQRYGLGDDMTTLNKMVNLVNRGATVDEAAQIVAMTNKQSEQQVQGSMQPQQKSEQRVQNPVHFTENPDAMRLELTQRN